MQWPDGRWYYGLWHANKMEGHGVYNWPDGSRYEGDFVNDLKQGCDSKYFWPDGCTYEGEYMNDK